MRLSIPALANIRFLGLFIFTMLIFSNGNALLAAPYEQVTPPLTTPFAYGVASGDMTSDSVVLWTRTPGAASVFPEIAEADSFQSPTPLTPVQTKAEADFTVKVVASGLKPGTQYYYRFKEGSNVSPVGTFKTAYAPDQNAKVTLGFSGDADWKWKPYPLVQDLVNEKMDFFFFLGDLIYETLDIAGNTSAEDLVDYRFKYRENREVRTGGQTPSLKQLYSAFGLYSVFDNHETGLSKADKNAPSYNEGGSQLNGAFANQTEGFKARIQAYREYQPVREQQISGTGDTRSDQTYRFYKAIPWGANVELIILDDRSYRDIRLAKSDDPETLKCSRNMLGETQTKWFQDELLSTKQRNVTWKIVVVSSPMQVLGRASQVGSDLDSGKSWVGGYNCERNKVLKFIDDNAIDNVVFLTTDNHYTVVNNLLYNTNPEDVKSPLKPARNAFEVLTGPVGASAGNPMGARADITGLSQRDADRKILDIWNGLAPDAKGTTQGLKQAGLDLIGLEANFPGLDTASIKSLNGKNGVADPINFVSFNTYAYALLTFDKDSIGVMVKGLPYVSDPATLNNPATLKEYEGRKATELLSFKVMSQKSDNQSNSGSQSSSNTNQGGTSGLPATGAGGDNSSVNNFQLLVIFGLLLLGAGLASWAKTRVGKKQAK